MRLVSTLPYALALLALAGALAGPACSGNATPVVRTCPTVAESVTYSANGSCGAGGLITVSTDPGFCDIKAVGGLMAGLPNTGYFNGNATTTGFRIAGGNWTLYVHAESTPEYTSCDAVASNRQGDLLELNCSFNACTPTDQDSYSCMLNPCVMHLAAPPMDAGVDSGMGDGGTEAGGDASSD